MPRPIHRVFHLRSGAFVVWRHGRTLALAALLGGAAACNSGGDAANTKREAPPVPVRVAAVAQRDVPVQVKAIGTVEAFSTVSVKSQVEGSLAEVHFSEGDAVRKGDLLFVIDPRPFESALRQAEANLAKEQAEARFAEVDAERRSELFKQGLVSRNEYDNAQTNAAALKAAANADAAAVENARLRLQYCYIHSPVDGRIGQLLVHEGNLVKQNDSTLAVINQVKPAYVAFAVPEALLPEIRERAAAGTLAVESISGEGKPEVRGELKFINNAVDRTTGTVLLKGLFANENEALWPGQFVEVALTLHVESGALVVPLAALQTGQQGQYVWVVSGERQVEVRPVVTGDVNGTEVVVREGLKPGETVVVDGQLRLAPGSRVEINADAGVAKS